MFHSETTSASDGTQDPDSVDIDNIYDDYYDEAWLQIRWSGAGYEDAWFLSKNEHVADLEENR